MKRLLLTGFEPFGAWADNPSWDALLFAREHGMLEGLDVTLAQVPVSYAGAWPAFERAFAGHDAVVSFGLHGGMRREQTTIYVETTARNRDGAAKADNDGIEHPAQPIAPDGPDTLPARLDAQGLVHRLVTAGFSAELSDNAGEYLCNHLFYRALNGLAPGIACGFVHVPPVQSIGGTLSLERLAEAVSLIAQEVAQP